MTRPEPAGAGTAEEPSICVGGRLITRSDVIKRLAGAGEHLGNAIAGYRDADNKRAAKGLFEAATAMLDAKALLEQQPSAITAAESRAMERCAKIADDQDYGFVGKYIAASIRSAINPPGDT